MEAIQFTNSSRRAPYLLLRVVLTYFISLFVVNWLHAQPTLKWVKTLNPAARITRINTDISGNKIIVGIFNSAVDFDPGTANSILIPVGQWDVFLAKYDPNGNYVWAFNIGNGSCVAYLNDLVTDSMGNIYVTGTFNASCSNNIDFDPGPNSFTLSGNSGKTDPTSSVQTDPTFPEQSDPT
jgi:hypothetical protein